MGKIFPECMFRFIANVKKEFWTSLIALEWNREPSSASVFLTHKPQQFVFVDPMQNQIQSKNRKWVYWRRFTIQQLFILWLLIVKGQTQCQTKECNEAFQTEFWIWFPLLQSNHIAAEKWGLQ